MITHEQTYTHAQVLAEVTESTREAEVVKQGVLVVKLRAEKIVNEIGGLV